jgi:hypothetical protein
VPHRRRIRDGIGAERKKIFWMRDDLRDKRNDLQLNRNGFFAGARSGTPDAF